MIPANIIEAGNDNAYAVGGSMDAKSIAYIDTYVTLLPEDITRLCVFQACVHAFSSLITGLMDQRNANLFVSLLD